jgi:hypothetical protein
MTTVVNIRKKKGKKRPHCDVLIDRTTPFGNRHAIGFCSVCNKVHDRKEAIAEYKKDFYICLTIPEFRDSVLAMKGKKLGCWCKPLPCHGDVIVEYLEKEPVWGIEKVYDGCMGGVNLEEW